MSCEPSAAPILLSAILYKTPGRPPHFLLTLAHGLPTAFHPFHSVDGFQHPQGWAIKYPVYTVPWLRPHLQWPFPPLHHIAFLSFSPAMEGTLFLSFRSLILYTSICIPCTLPPFFYYSPHNFISFSAQPRFHHYDPSFANTLNSRSFSASTVFAWQSTNPS